MSIITIFGLLMFFYAAKSLVSVFKNHDYSGRGVNYILLFGSLAVTFGFLGQAIGMFQAFSAIKEAGDISPALIVGGLQVSMIAPLYGSLIFIISLPIWVMVRERIKKNR